MNATVETEAAHAVYAPSSAHRWAEEDGCSASAEAISALGEQEEGEEAAEGTRAHDEIERVLGPYSGDGLGWWLENPATLIEPLNEDHPAAFGIALVLDYIRQLPPGTLWVEQRVRLTGQIWGRCDVCHWHEESATLTVVDYKNGFVGVDAIRNAQLRIYGAGSIRTHNLPAKWIRYAVVQPNDFRPVPRIKQWAESAESLQAFATRVAAIPQGPKQFKAGKQCTYCPLFGRCEASRDLLGQVGALVAGLMSPEDVTPAQRALFLACKKPIEDAFKKAEKVWTKQALSGAVPPGLGLFTSQPHRVWLDIVAAREAVVAKGGVEALEVPSPAQAEKLGIDVSKLAKAPDGGPVLAFAGDSRKPWIPKSVPTMFAGVAAGLAK